MAGTDSEFLFGVGGVQAPSLILAPWLYLGDASIAFTNAALKSLGITHIVPVMPEFHKPPYPNVKTCFSCVAYYQDFQYHHVVALDRPDQDLLQFFPECCKFIDAAKATNGRVLIHWYIQSDLSCSYNCIVGLGFHGLLQCVVHILCGTFIDFAEEMKILQG